MRYVLLGPAYPLRGGISQFNARLYQLLRERGHVVRAFNFIRQYPGFLFPGRTQEDQSQKAEHIHAVRMLDSIGPGSWLRTAAAVQLARPDVLVVHHWMPFFAPAYGSVSALVRVASRAKVVWICHNLTPHEPQPGGTVLNALGLLTAHGFIVMSEAVERDLLRLRRGARYRRVQHPVEEPAARAPREEARRQLRLPQHIPVLLFFGYVRPYKGLQVLLRALREVLETRQVFLLVAGEFYEPREKYEELIRKLGLRASVALHDVFVPNEKLAWYFAACDAVVLPYRSATQSGVVPLAYAHGRPVITTAVGGLPEVVAEGKTGVLAPPNDPHALAEAILRFLQLRDRVDWQREIAAVQRTMSWGHFVDALEALVEELRGAT